MEVQIDEGLENSNSDDFGDVEIKFTSNDLEWSVKSDSSANSLGGSALSEKSFQAEESKDHQIREDRHRQKFWLKGEVKETIKTRKDHKSFKSKLALISKA